jgi:hypothetical protein
LIFLGPINQVQVEIILQIGSVQYFVRFFAYSAILLLDARLNFVKALSDIDVAMIFRDFCLRFIAERHNFMVRNQINLIKYALTKQLLITG